MCTPHQRWVLRNIRSNHCLNHKTSRILSIEVFSNSIWIVSYRPVKWWQSATQFISSKITFTLSDRFCLVAIQSSCFVEFCMVLALNPISQSSVGTYLKYRDVLPSSCMFFHFAPFLTPSVTFLIRTERLYSENGFTEAVCSWNFFHKHWNISSPRNTLYQLFSKRQIYHILFESAIFNQTANNKILLGSLMQKF